MNVEPRFKAPRRSSRSLYARSRTEIIERSQGRCEARIEHVCRGRGSHAHHRLPRSRGGGDTASNLAWLCSLCHAHIHAHPAESVAAGWLIPSEPYSTAVLSVERVER